MVMSMFEAAQKKIDEAAGEPQEETPEAPATEALDDLLDEAEQEGTVEEAKQTALEDEVEEQPTVEEAAAAEEAGQAAVDALPEDATQEEQDAARKEGEDEFYAGTYKTREAAEQGIREQTLTIDRLFSENNDLKQQIAAAQEETAAEVRIDPVVWDNWASEQVANGNGEEAALVALREVGFQGYEIVMRNWLAVTENEDMTPEEAARERANAIMFKDAVLLEMTEQRANSVMQEQAARPDPAQVQTDAHAIALNKYSDLDEYTADMRAEVEQMQPEDRAFLKQLAEDGVEGSARALEMVYLRAKAKKGPSSQERAQAAETRRRIASEDAATLAATTSTAEGVATRTPPPRIVDYALERKRGIRERQNLPPLEE
jgi:hypothetical protein